MKRIEIILTSIIVITIILKLALIPGGGPFLVFSITLLACYYYIFGIFIFNGIAFSDILKTKSYEDLKFFHIITTFFLGAGLSNLLMGVLFKTFNWLSPTADIFFLSGFIFIFKILFIYLIKNIKNKVLYLKRIGIRIAVIASLALIFIFISETTLVKIQYQNHPEYVKAYIEYKNNPENTELKDKLDIEYKKIYE